MDFTKQLKAVAWTEAEVVVMLAGAIGSNQFLSDEKIFKNKFASNPEWFQGSREGAPFYIKHSGLLKAGVALYGSSFIKNPWLKLALMGVAFQGTLQEVRVLTYDKANSADRVDRIGAGASNDLDAKLRAAAANFRVSGMNDSPTYVAGLKNNPTFVANGFSYKTKDGTYGF